jgi:hypothetical protein
MTVRARKPFVAAGYRRGYALFIAATTSAHRS